MKKESLKEEFKPCLHSHLSTHGQSLAKVVLIGELLMQKVQIHPPDSNV